MRSSITPLEIFCEKFVDSSYENNSFLILEDSTWLQLIDFLTTIPFWTAKSLFPIDRDSHVTYLRVLPAIMVN